MRAFMGTLLIAVLLAACAGSGGRRMNTDIRRGPMPQGGTWAGVWFTNWGQLSLQTQGSAVVGEFCDEESNRYGRLEGSAQGNVLSFHWVTHDSTMQGRSRTSEGSGIVQFSFVESGEVRGMHFEGTWGFGQSNAGGSTLRGDRSSRYSDQFLSGSFTIPCPMRDQAEDGPPLSDEDVGDNPEPEEEPLDEGFDEGGEEGGVEEESLDI